MTRKTTNTEKETGMRNILDQLRELSHEKTGEFAEKVQGMYEDARTGGQDAFKKAAKMGVQMDHHARKNPWLYVGGAAIGGIIAGLVLRGKR